MTHIIEILVWPITTIVCVAMLANSITESLNWLRLWRDDK